MSIYVILPLLFFSTYKFNYFGIFSVFETHSQGFVLLLNNVDKCCSPFRIFYFLLQFFTSFIFYVQSIHFIHSFNKSTKPVLFYYYYY